MSDDSNTIESIEPENTVHAILQKKFIELFSRTGIDENQERIETALKVIGQNQYQEMDLVALGDTSTKQNGSSGFILTNDAICISDCANWTKEDKIIMYEEIEKMVYNKGTRRIEMATANKEFFQISINAFEKERLVIFLNYAREIQQKLLQNNNF